MNKNLCIDWGNTRIKAGLFQGEEIKETFNFSKEEALVQIQVILKEYAPKNTILCMVSHVESDFMNYLRENTQLLILNNDTKLPIINAYSSAHTLGMDRVALSVGMQEVFPAKNNLVVCLGSAITYNFCQKNGIFRGGNITPGMQMRFKALQEHTENLPLISEKGEVLLLGYDTETCIRSGVILGIAAEIDGMVNNYRSQFPDFNVLLTGGDCALFEDRLKNRLSSEPLLLLKGLNTILNYNVR